LKQINTPYCVVSNDRKYYPKIGYSYDIETRTETTLLIKILEKDHALPLEPKA
jgi:hypothetical protein